MFRTTSELSTLHIPVKFVSKKRGLLRQIQGIHLDTLNWLYANLHLPGMNDQKYDELQKYLAEGQYHAGASKSDKYVLR